MNYKDDENQLKQNRQILMITNIIDAHQNENEEVNEKEEEEIFDICNKIASCQYKNMSTDNIIQSINKLINYPQYDFITEKLFNMINPLVLRKHLLTFIRRNEGSILLNKINSNEVLKVNDEISWNIIAQMIVF